MPTQQTIPDTDNTASGVREEFGRDAERLKETAADRARQEAEKGKGQAARTAQSASSALRSAAGELENDDSAPAWLASAVRQTADKLGQLAGQVDNRSVDDIQQQVVRFARSNPATFLAASAAAGFAAARVLRAGADHRSHEAGQDTSTGYGGYDDGHGPNAGEFEAPGDHATAVPMASAGVSAGGTS